MYGHDLFAPMPPQPPPPASQLGCETIDLGFEKVMMGSWIGVIFEPA
jgi:hypothetical protein